MAVHIGATWLIRTTEPSLCAAAMRPFVKLLWPLVILVTCLQCFDTVGRASGRAPGLCWHGYLFRPRCRWFASSLASLISGMVLPFWWRITEVFLEKRPSNGCRSFHLTTAVLMLVE